jgi:hypothetical protein
VLPRGSGRSGAVLGYQDSRIPAEFIAGWD